MAAHTSQTTTSCRYIRTLQYALHGYMGVGYSPQYIYYELLIVYNVFQFMLCAFLLVGIPAQFLNFGHFICSIKYYSNFRNIVCWVSISYFSMHSAQKLKKVYFSTAPHAQ